MAGPTVQMPGSATPMIELVRDDDGNIIDVRMRPEWVAYFSLIGQIAFSATRAGSTSARPDSNMVRWIGMPYFDQQIGKEVFLKFATSNVWVTSDGTVS